MDPGLNALPSAGASSKPRILVVEDSFLTAQTLCDLLVKNGCDVAGTVGHVESGIDFVRHHEVDGAVVDLDLHGTASFPICEQLHKRAIPFFFLTGYDRDYPVPPEFRKTPWLYKPVDDREFEVAIAGLARNATATAGRGNMVLERLSAADWRELRARAERVALTAGQVLCAERAPVASVYFPIDSLVSVTARAPGGKPIEIGVVGRDGVVGVEVALGRARSAGCETVVHTSGDAWRVAAGDLTRLFDGHAGLRAELLGAVHAFLEELADSAAAIGTGTIEQRLAGRLLRTALRSGSRTLAVTHESLARLMAVRRSGVTVALHMLESKHVIRSRRNQVEILDFEGLARASGEAR